jgi:SAM-dependent methyltransferase
MIQFSSPELGHQHSLETLNGLYEYDDFMQSITNVVDMGCGAGHDLEWWATRTTRDESARPLNIKCLGVDQVPELSMAHKYRNIRYSSRDFEQTFPLQKLKYDVVWSHDSFQYAINPIATLSNWWNIMSDGGMLVVIIPQTTNLEFNVQAYDQYDYCYYNWTMTSLIHALAVSGFDCGSGFFKKKPTDVWLHAVVYKSAHKPMDPRSTTWYQLSDLNLLPESVVRSVQRHGYLRQKDLLLPWLDKSLMSMAQH